MNDHALILVDLQNDFLPGGALPVPEGDQVIPVANDLMVDFEIIVATQDWHPADHASFAANHPGKSLYDTIELEGLPQTLWPVHCVQGSPGADLAATLEQDRITRVFTKGTRAEVDSYSGFFDNGRQHQTGLAVWLQAHAIDTVHICGLATDYCVKFTALDAVQLGLKTRLELAACRGVNLRPGDVHQAIDEMRSAGVQVIQ